MHLSFLIFVIFLVILVICVWTNASNRENMGGFGVTTGLAFNNRLAYCDPGNETVGGAFSGGCFLPHRVII